MMIQMVNPYLHFRGDCETAFKFYEQVLGGKIGMMMRFSETPMAQQMPAAMQNQVVHVRMTVGNSVLMGSDAPPDRYSPPQGFSVSISVDKPADAERIFHALAEKGTVGMPIAETFWAQRFGMLVDRFGIPWMVNCEKN
jgi:PhnB protein